MGKPCFSKLTKFFAVALLGAATAIAAIAVLSTPAAADSHTRGGGNDGTLKEWDTDNLARWVSSNVGTVSAKNYRIPYHNYRYANSSGTCGAAYTVSQAKHFGCQSAVADAFFQTGGDTSAVNDFPVADYGSDSRCRQRRGSIGICG